MHQQQQLNNGSRHPVLAGSSHICDSGTPQTQSFLAVSSESRCVSQQGSDTPSTTVIGSRSKNNVCFQCVGMLFGPVLKLTTLSTSRNWLLFRRWGARLPPTGQTSAKVGSLGLITWTSVPGGTGSPVTLKNVSKYNTKAETFARRSDVDTRLKGEAKSS